MIAVFCLRLGWGLSASLLVLLSSPINPRFYRTHLLTCVALSGVAAYFLRENIDLASGAMFAATIGCGFLGAFLWMLEGAPGGRIIIVLTVAAWTALMFQAPNLYPTGVQPAWELADHLLSGVLLGAVVTAMLMGHLYLIAPSMSLAPLVRLLIFASVAVAARIALAGCGVWLWKSSLVGSIETETWLWLAVRWGVGFLIPLVLLWMAWETTRIRSTQSATGILYVLVILCFLGELTSQLLLHKTNYVL